MILEAFAEYLHAADTQLSATEVLARWLWERLSAPPETNVDRVLHCEILVALGRGAGDARFKEIAKRSDIPRGKKEDDEKLPPTLVFKGCSSSGKKLLKSLYEYCLSYEQQKWARFVHNLKATDFNGRV